MKKQYILVTGGTGYIGSHTVVCLVDSGYEVVIIDNFSNSNSSVLDGIASITGKKPLFEQGDCTDELFLNQLFDKYTFSGVIHFAAFKAVGESVEAPLSYYHNNINGLITLLNVMQNHNVFQLVFSSSCTVYGIPVNTIQVDEKTPLGTPNSPYGWTKWMGEQIIRDIASANSNFNVALLRYFNPVGAHESGIIGELPQGIPNNILPYITQTAAGIREKLTVFGSDYPTDDGTCIRDYVHVMDIAEAHVVAIEYISKTSGCSIFNLGTGTGTSVLELIAAFETVIQRPLNWDFGPRRAGDVDAIFADVSLVNQEMNWSAKRTVKQAVKDAWKWELNRLE